MSTINHTMRAVEPHSPDIHDLRVVEHSIPSYIGVSADVSNPTVARRRSASPMNDGSHKDAVSEAQRRLIGTWCLVAFTRNGQPHPVYGRRPSGLIRYDESGAMAVQIMPERAHPPSSVPVATPDATQTIPGYIAYFGRYSVDQRAKTVAHHRFGNVTPGEPATVVRHYEFCSDDRLALTLGEETALQVLWQRVR